MVARMSGAWKGSARFGWGRTFRTLISPASAHSTLDSTCLAVKWGESAPHRGQWPGALEHLAAEQPWWGQRGRRPEAGSRRRPLRGVDSALGRTRLFAAAFHRCLSPGVPRSDLAAPRVTTARWGWAERSTDPTGELGGCGCSSMEWGLPGGHSPMGTAQRLLRLSRGFGLLT